MAQGCWTPRIGFGLASQGGDWQAHLLSDDGSAFEVMLDGQAVATIEQQDGKGAYSCGGCFMAITAETVNMLMTKDDILRCPNCARILTIASSNES